MNFLYGSTYTNNVVIIVVVVGSEKLGSRIFNWDQ